MDNTQNDIHRREEKDAVNSPSIPPMSDPKNIQDLTQYEREWEKQKVSVVLQQTQNKFQCMSDQILSRIDEMGHKIDDLEKTITELMAQAGPEEPEK